MVYGIEWNIDHLKDLFMQSPPLILHPLRQIFASTCTDGKYCYMETL